MYATEPEVNGKYYPTRIGIAPEIQVEIIEILNKTLASTIDLWMQIKCSHWNVKGMQFFSLHQLFDTLAEQLDSFADLIAERVTALGGVALGAVQVAVKQSQIAQYPDNLQTGQEHVRAIAEGMAAYVR
ncbi:MAG: DNA starvation/stationary phase protection protein Dps [Leptolyngbyaceae cyanobacterium MO_188.B28]|nr:DNA starvation/stationary phase protection protein Dps [Leptolyngbyaceae cyanobacterium MO_188.B28]